MRSRRRQFLAAVQAFHRNCDGAQALEFGLVAIPFFSLVFATFGFCLYFFTCYGLENAVWQAARDLRTGRMQLGQGVYAGVKGTDLKVAFKKSVCSSVPPFIDCNNKLRVIVQSTPDFKSIVEPSCLAGDGSLIADANAQFNAGGVSSVVLVTACYAWDMAAAFPFLSLGNMKGGARLIQASAAFRSEPYSN